MSAALLCHDAMWPAGLDAFQAQNVMEALWTLAGNGRTSEWPKAAAGLRRLALVAVVVLPPVCMCLSSCCRPAPLTTTSPHCAPALQLC